MRTYGFTFHVRARMNDEVTIEDACDAAEASLYYAETLFIFLMLLDPQRIKGTVIDGESLCAAFQMFGEIGQAFISVALEQIGKLESERERLIAFTTEKGGAQ